MVVAASSVVNVAMYCIRKAIVFGVFNDGTVVQVCMLTF